MTPAKDLSIVLERLKWASLVVGVVGALLCVAGALHAPHQFFPAYLVAYLFWLAIALGCLAVSMIHNLTGGAWGQVTRRALESAFATMPLLALLFVPIGLGTQSVYVWARPEAMEHDPKLAEKAGYLNVDAWSARAVVYFLVWIVLSLLLSRWEESDDPATAAVFRRRRQLLSGPGLAIYALTITLASVDWVMSIEPAWYSTMYGTIFMGGQAVAGLAFAILVTGLLRGYEPWRHLVDPFRWHDLGNLLLAFVMFWIYVAFFQYLITWGGDLSEEVPWYTLRSAHGWQWIALALVAFHFFVPFFLLLSRDVKKHPRLLGSVCGLLLVMRWVDWYWLAAPPFFPDGVAISWWEPVTMCAIGGFWMAAFVRRLAYRAQLPLDESQLEEHRDERSKFEAR